MSLDNGSASATDRTFQCASSLVLPRVERDTVWSARGHGIHRFCRAVLSGVPMASALETVPNEHRETCRAIDWRKLGGDLTDVRVEAAYALDVRARTARFLGLDIGRDYERAALRLGQPLGPWEVPGALDIEGMRDVLPVVLDLKSGFQDVTPAEENGQGLFFGAVKHLMTGADEVEFRIGKLKPSGDVYVQRATYTALDIDIYLDRYEAALEASKEARRVYLAGGTPDVHEGPACQWCGAADACPAKTRMVRAMLGELAEIDRAVEMMPVEQAGRAWEYAHERAQPMLKRIIAVLNDRARREALPLSNGDVAREIKYERESLHTESALALLKELGATEEQLASIYRTAPVSSVRRVQATRSRRSGGRAA